MNFSLRTAFPVSHKFWTVVSSFSFLSRSFLISFFTSLLTHSLFNTILLYNEWGKNDIKEEIKYFLKISENELTTVQNLWDRVKAVLRGKFIAIQDYLKRIEENQDGGVGRHTAPPRTTRTDRKLNGEEV